MHGAIRAVAMLVCLFVLTGTVQAQPPVSLRNSYERILVILPIIGSGNAADPYRPSLIPAPGSTTPNILNITIPAPATNPDGHSEKAWSFDTVATDAGFGLQNSAQSRLQHSTITGETMAEPISSLDAAGNPYVSKLYTIVDYGNPTTLAKETTQTVDQYGNVTQMQIYGYGAVGSSLPLLRTYTNTYLNTSAYTSLYILNRLLTSTVTDGTNSTTLVTESYDQTTPINVTGIYEHYSGYGTSWLTRGNVTTSVTPSGTTLRNFDIAGNVTLTNVNGMVTTSTVSSTSNYAAPSAADSIASSRQVFLKTSSMPGFPSAGCGRCGSRWEL